RANCLENAVMERWNSTLKSELCERFETCSAAKGFFFDVVEVAGLKGKMSFHGLRHLFAVRLLTRGVPITIVSELLGHSDINLTVKRYGRFASDAKVKFDAVRVLDQPLASPTPVEIPPRAPQPARLEVIE